MSSQKYNYAFYLKSNGSIDDLIADDLEEAKIDYHEIDTENSPCPESAFVELKKKLGREDFKNLSRYHIFNIQMGSYQDFFDEITSFPISKDKTLDISKCDLVREIKPIETGNVKFSLLYYSREISQIEHLILPDNLNDDEKFKRDLSYILPKAFPRQQQQNQRDRSDIPQRNDNPNKSTKFNPPKREFNTRSNSRTKTIVSSKFQPDDEDEEDEVPPKQPKQEVKPTPRPSARTESKSETKVPVPPPPLPTQPQPQVTPESVTSHQYEYFRTNAFIDYLFDKCDIEASSDFYDENAKFSITADPLLTGFDPFTRNLLFKDTNLIIGDPVPQISRLLGSFQKTSVLSSLIVDGLYSVVVSGICTLSDDSECFFDRTLTLIETGEGETDFMILSDQIHFS